MMVKFLVIVLFLNTFNLISSETKKEQGRTLPGPVIPLLLVPPTAPTRHQLIWGVGIPNQIKFESIIYGLVLKAQYYLPDAINTNFPLKPSMITWPGLGFLKKRAVRDVGWDDVQQMKYENYTGNVEVVTEEVIREINTARETELLKEMKAEKGDEEVKGMTRWDLYTAIEAVAKQYGFGDKECILRAICEAAEVPFSHDSGIVGELMHLFLTPLTSADRVTRNSDNEYLFAEHVGRSQGNCEYIFKSCKQSLLEVFTGIHDPLLYAVSGNEDF